MPPEAFDGAEPLSRLLDSEFIAGARRRWRSPEVGTRPAALTPL